MNVATPDMIRLTQKEGNWSERNFFSLESLTFWLVFPQESDKKLISHARWKLIIPLVMVAVGSNYAERKVFSFPHSACSVTVVMWKFFFLPAIPFILKAPTWHILVLQLYLIYFLSQSIPIICAICMTIYNIQINKNYTRCISLIVIILL
jgi:hypothetical protein